MPHDSSRQRQPQQHGQSRVRAKSAAASISTRALAADVLDSAQPAAPLNHPLPPLLLPRLLLLLRWCLWLL